MQDGFRMDLVTKGSNTRTENNLLRSQKGQPSGRMTKQRPKSCLQFSMVLCPQQWTLDSNTSGSPGELLKNGLGPTLDTHQSEPGGYGLGSCTLMSARDYPAEACLLPALHIMWPPPNSQRKSHPFGLAVAHSMPFTAWLPTTTSLV